MVAVRRLGKHRELLVPLAGFAFYVVALGVRASRLSAASFLYADAPESAYLGANLVGGSTLPPHTELVPTLLSGVLLRSPLGHAGVQLLGPLFGVLAAVAVAVSVGRLRGSWAAAVAALAAGPIVLWSFLWPTAHAFSMAATAVTGLVVVTLASSRTRAFVAAAAGLALGTVLSSDAAFLAEGLVPALAAAGVLSWYQRRRAPVLLTILAAALAVAATAALAGLESVAGIRVVGLPGSTPADPATGVSTMMRTFAAIVSGRWYFDTLPVPLEAVAMAAGLAIPLLAPLCLVVELRRARLGDVRAARLAYLMFWAASDVLVLAAFIGFGYGAPDLGGHYLIPCFLSAAATLPFIPWRRPAATVFVAGALAGVQAVGLLQLPASDFAGPVAPSDAGAVLSVLRANHLTRGYADYWIAHPLSWLSDETVSVAPVEVRNCYAGARVCRYLYSDLHWYEPQPGPSFLLVRRSYPCVSSTAPGLGPPRRVIPVDSDVTVLVFDDDIARRFTPEFAFLCA